MQCCLSTVLLACDWSTFVLCPAALGLCEAVLVVVLRPLLLLLLLLWLWHCLPFLQCRLTLAPPAVKCSLTAVVCPYILPGFLLVSVLLWLCGLRCDRPQCALLFSFMVMSVLVTLLSSVPPVAVCLLAVVPYRTCLCFAVVVHRRLCCCGNDGNLFGDACFCATSAAMWLSVSAMVAVIEFFWNCF